MKFLNKHYLKECVEFQSAWIVSYLLYHNSEVQEIDKILHRVVSVAVKDSSPFMDIGNVPSEFITQKE